MEATFDRKQLLQGIKRASRGVSKSGIVPILSHILLEAGSDGVKLSATDLELGLECRVPATVHEGGAISLPGKILRDTVAALAEALVTIAADENHQAIVTCGSSKHQIRGLPAAEFPLFAESGGALTFNLPAGTLREMASQTIYAASSEKALRELTGISVSLAGERLTFAATDSYRLAVRTATVQSVHAGAGGAEVAVIVPKRALLELIRLLDVGSEEAVSIKVDQNQILFRTGSDCLVSRLIEGKFPNYEKVISWQHTTKLTIPVEAFRQAVKRVAVAARQNNNRMVLRTWGQKLLIRAGDGVLDGSHTEVDVQREGADIEIAFNARYVLDVLGVLQTDHLYLQMSEPMCPAVIRPVGDPDYLAVIMPMRIA